MRTTLIVAMLACIAVLHPVAPAAAQSSSTSTTIARQISRLDTTYARFEARAERLADSAIARMEKLERAGASPARISTVAAQAEAALEGLAATFRADLARIETATLSVINRHESVSSQLRAFPTVNFNSLRISLQNKVDSLSAKSDLTLDDEFQRIERALAEALPDPVDGDAPF